MPSLREKVFWDFKEGSCPYQLEIRERCLEKVASHMKTVEAYSKGQTMGQ